MKHLLENYYGNVIVYSEFSATKTVKEGEEVEHINRVKMIEIFNDVYDNIGMYLKTEKITIHQDLLKAIINQVSKTESETKIMKYYSNTCF